MFKKILGIFLLLAAGIIAFFIVQSGNPLWPHLIGPLGFGLVGLILLARGTGWPTRGRKHVHESRLASKQEK